MVLLCMVFVVKAFDHDLASARKLASDFLRTSSEDFVCCIDHYLGKDMFQTLMTFRFANGFIEPLFCWDHVSCVRTPVKEDFGTGGRGGYLMSYGFIRDQNHLAQMHSVVAMDMPRSAAGSAKRVVKVAAIRVIRAIYTEDVVGGQYIGVGSKPGYLDDDSITARARAELVPFCGAAQLARAPRAAAAGRSRNSAAGGTSSKGRRSEPRGSCIRRSVGRLSPEASVEAGARHAIFSFPGTHVR